MHAHGEFPATLYRSFDRLEYAQRFCSGEMRFGSVISYRKIEDAKRRDQSEGIGHLEISGVQNKVEFASNACYALCCHRSIEASLASNHGSYVVEINDPLWLAEEMSKVLKASGSKYFGGVEGVPVAYTKGQAVSAKPSSYEMSRLAYAQKPEEFAKENEFRFVFIRKGFAGKNITLFLPSPIPGALVHEYT